MKRFLLAFLCFWGASFAVTPFPAIKHHKVLLSAVSSPYLLETSFVLGAEDTLEIEPGVEVFFSGYAKLYLRGMVHINGTVQKPVAFLNADSSESWNGLYFSTGDNYFEVKNLRVENSFRNTVIRSQGIFENVKFVNNYYGLWVENSPRFDLVGCDFKRNRFALSVGVGSVRFRNTKIHENVFGLYLYKGTTFDGDAKSVTNNLEADIRKESDELAGKGRKVSKSVWQRIESGF
ncbi:MAG: right-handed parallel beta-helix repeat-containing protein [Hallerella sp.]|jgi:hypothetical protein|nr:right-handed parallel beta-helix repeat-containing protein [Fibrobacter sp.]MDY6368424.1 right-handed parallel beta-helix repeat-containing protein [Fibrobacter sp.]MDY6390928.1 right-handed parallel beta-helix repeat-containing protein [Fibrobacter sp.]MEE3339123.1 right-handed parallel beta-helix repeat-containing protein [Hallerella sp.]